ncbi:YfiR family protein [Bermanella marisrubri]|uniref:Putative transmembrane protein n=1 Tax=Bermanella marisrubri TaxID=207949 RepID=Q1N452_9GAMM|nr:YfiR family protein [Bermanella marisrubri]EAT13013.1 putative transmembrane protein [Oceanobacter sp. RED65] [Bermanella marisrubri]QIZ82860.1 YfiR family protein [Bermanella marisrubri]
MAKGWRAATNIPIGALVLMLVLASASYGDLKEDQVKAAYLYQISKFVFWPPSLDETQTFTVCQLGPDSYSGNLSKLNGRSVADKPIKVIQISSLDQVTNCQLLILSEPERVSAKELEGKLKQTPILTVVDGQQNHQKGMVVFVIEDQRVRLHINLNLAKQARLTFAANLLEVATHIYRGSEG